MTTIERDQIGIFGKMNSGKSSLINLLTQQETSIVDPFPGTTADTRVAVQEIHGLGPVKLYDTAGLDEESGLGEKKRKKVLNLLEECDLVLLAIDPASKEFGPEREVVRRARNRAVALFPVYNLFRSEDREQIPALEESLPELKLFPRIALSVVDPGNRPPLLKFVKENYRSRNFPAPLLPSLKRDEYYLLVIPMDVETPAGRLLRPQAMVEEYVTRNWAYPISFRLDLGRGRSRRPGEREAEKARFLGLINGLPRPPRLIVTDSQALDLTAAWCPPEVELTTFSIVMANYQTRGRIDLFARGAGVLKHLRAGDRVLIAEACNHSRIGEDIGTVQIPRLFRERFPGVKLEHNFGREFKDPEELRKYRLIIHCGGCMITPQRMLARVRELESLKVPVTNYGLVLAWFQGPGVLDKVLAPWRLPPPG
ncbi:MAG: GTPase [Candidatus Erginobacter occultus]|nr:GTPase [Candidatus Erginobacter occultus]